MSRPMACELELDNVARLANIINQRVEKMVEPSACQWAVQRADEGLEWVFRPARQQAGARRGWR